MQRTLKFLSPLLLVACGPAFTAQALFVDSSEGGPLTDSPATDAGNETSSTDAAGRTETGTDTGTDARGTETSTDAGGAETTTDAENEAGLSCCTVTDKIAACTSVLGQDFLCDNDAGVRCYPTTACVFTSPGTGNCDGVVTPCR